MSAAAHFLNKKGFHPASASNQRKLFAARENAKEQDQKTREREAQLGKNPMNFANTSSFLF